MYFLFLFSFFFFFQAEDGIRDPLVTGVQTCALPISQARIGVFVPFRVASNGGPALGVMGSPRAKLVPNWCTTQWIEQRFPACSPARCSERSGRDGRIPQGPVGDPTVSCRASRL